MVAELTFREVAELIERSRRFKNMPLEKIILLLGRVAHQPCDDRGAELFDALCKEGGPSESEFTQYRDHVRQCISCGEFLRDMWRTTSRDGY